jgi:hypothetical protein
MRRVMVQVAMSDGMPPPLRAIMLAAERLHCSDVALGESIGHAG